MGTDSSISFKFASEKRCVTYEHDGRAHHALLENARETTSALLKICTEVISKKYKNENFMVHMESYHDYDHDYKDWLFIKNGNKVAENSYICYQNDGYSEPKTKGNDAQPEWWVEFPSQSSLHGIACMTEHDTNIVYFHGEFDAEIFEQFAYCLHYETDYKVIDYDAEKKACLYDGYKVLISSLSEKDQETFFGIKPERKNLTASLFMPTLAPELLAVYGSAENAKRGYDKGEFALWETPEGIKLYTNWRSASWDTQQRRQNYETFARLLPEQKIQGDVVDTNPFLQPAQQQFAADALQYWNGWTNDHFGRVPNEKFGPYLEYKIVQNSENKLVQINFKLSDFYPI